MPGEVMSSALSEAQRQAEICNACRYCEGYCAVFPAMHAERAFAAGDLVQLANLCHNCRGCYYACQYTAPHEFAMNLPGALAEARQESWARYAWPGGFGGLFERSGGVIALGLVLCFAALLALTSGAQAGGGEGFYAFLSHGMMVAIFAPAFVLPLAAMAVSLRRYWRAVGGKRLRLSDGVEAGRAAAGMRNLRGGHGQGCNFEAEDRFTRARLWAHQAALWGFLMCFASTSAGTALHYGFGWEAPYGFWTLPKLLGVPGGVLLCVGTGWLAYLKLRADPSLGAARVWGGEMGFVLLLFWVSLSGLILYAANGSGAVRWLLALHLGAVFTFFVLLPYSKMAHGFYRFAALMRDAQRRREAV